jgi:hypothetical protein
MDAGKNNDILKIFIYPEEHLRLPGDMTRERVPFLGSMDEKPAPEGPGPNNVRRTGDVLESDYILFPFYLEPLLLKYGYINFIGYLRSLPYFRQFEGKHIFCLRETLSIPFYTTSFFFRTNVESSVRDINAFAMPFFVEDFRNFVHYDLEKCSYDTSFVGYLGSSSIRFKLAKNILQTKRNLRHMINVSGKFHGHLDREIREQRRMLFVGSLKDSITILCPAGMGKGSIRFFEAMSMGRIPVLISDDCMLPFEDEIDYSAFSLRINESDIEKAGDILSEWLGSHSSEELRNKCMTSRSVWENYLRDKTFAMRTFEKLHRLKNGQPENLARNVPVMTGRQSLLASLRNFYRREYQRGNYLSSLQYARMIFWGTDSPEEAGEMHEICPKLYELVGKTTNSMNDEIDKLQSGQN